MFFPEAGVRVWLYTQPTDMHDGLSALVKNKLQEDHSQWTSVCLYQP